MTSHAEARLTRYTFAITVTLCGALAVSGLIIGSTLWPRAAAATAVPGIEITSLMSNVDAAKLPATEISDLF
jgi:hypothetical protein